MMITLRCDKCEKTLTVPDEQAGTKLKCPACGDINVIPPLKAASGGVGDRAVAKGFPSAGAPEATVLRTRTAMLRSHPLAFLIASVLIVGGLAAGIVGGLVTPVAIAGWIAAGGALVYLLGWKVSTWGWSLEVTNKRVIERKGLFSKFTSEIRHQDIRNIQVTQSFPERVMGVGKLALSSSGQEDMEVLIKDIPSPHRVKEIIDLYRPL